MRGRVPKRLTDDRWLTIAAVARLLGVSRAKVYGLIASGQVNVDALISATAPLSEGAKWFDRLYRRESGLLKVILTQS